MNPIKFWLNNRKIKKQNKLSNSFPKERKYTIHICQFNKCKQKLGTTNRYHCPYCDREFCSKHRIPEEHGCKNPKTPREMKQNSSVLSFSGGKTSVRR